jgi:pimeloyl-ACP methyl ester carboxylesterase
LTESGAEFQAGRREELKQLLGPKLAASFNYLVINKPGLLPGKVDKKAFESSFRRYRRVSDSLATLRKIIPARDKICLVGYSEGAYLAPEVALGDPRVKSVVIIGGGTRGWLKEEFSRIKGAREKTALLRQVERIRKNPRSEEKWNGFSYATWHSYQADSTLQALRRIEVPVLSILGKRDRVIDLKATLRDLGSLSKKKNIRTEVFHDCGHSFINHWSDVRRKMVEFLNP